MNDDARIIDIVKSAIENNRIDEARSLLRPLMKRNVTEAFYLASRVAYTQEQALQFLRYALELDPDNRQVSDALGELETLYANQTNLVIADPDAAPPVSTNIKAKVEKTVALFKRYGWQVIIQEDDNAQFMRRDTMSAVNAFVLGLGLHLFGVILTIILLLSAQRLHSFIEADDDELFLSSTKGDMLLHRPQQAVIFLDKHNGVSMFQGILWAMIGMLITTAIIALLMWQLSLIPVDSWIEPFLVTPIYPDA